MFAVVINDTFGLIDCFGFNQIAKSELERIVHKFYNDDEHIYLNPAVIKTLLKDAEKITRKTGNKVSYEYLCWEILLADIQIEPVPIELILKSKYSQKPLTEIELEKIYLFDFIQKWFFDIEYNEGFNSLISHLNAKMGSNDFNFDFEEVINKYFDKIFTVQEKAALDKRILMSSYLKYLSEGKQNAAEEAQLLYSLYYDEENKIKLSENIIKKSIYEYYVLLKFKYKEKNKTTNIFTMRNKQKDFELTQKQVDLAISVIEGLWVQNGKR